MTDLHMHTVFCDGNNTPEEMVRSAMEKGFSCVGISGHSYTWYDESYCMSQKGTEEYRQELARLKTAYAGKIRVLCGVEQDLFAGRAEGFDYAIGSVHYFRFGEDYVPVDHTPDCLREAADKYCGGDFYTLCEAYFDTVSHVIEETGADIIGHFDLICKYNEKLHLFDESHPRYIAAWQRAARKLLETGKPFEVNLGAVIRGLRSEPYPSKPILDWLIANGASFVVNSDSHASEAVGYSHEEWETYILSHGGKIAPIGNR